MITVRVVFVTIALAAMLVGRGVWSATGVSNPNAQSPNPKSQTAQMALMAASPSISDQADNPRDTDTLPAQYDIYGNEVDDAVGDYRVDTLGLEYEEHSPDTEVLHLGPAVL